MGLDFYGFYLRKGETLDDYYKMSYEDQEKRELFYARKGWELVYALRCDTQNDCTSKLELEDWVNLMKILSPIGPFLNEINTAYATLEEHWDDFDNIEDFKNAYPREHELVDTYEKWFDDNFDVSPQLGYDFSIGYMINFWEACDNVIEYLKDPDYEVWMIASY